MVLAVVYLLVSLGASRLRFRSVGSMIPSVFSELDGPNGMDRNTLNSQPLDPSPDDYKRFVLDEVHEAGENLTLVYAGRKFGGVVRCLLDPNGVEAALRAGTEIFIRYHTPETGMPGSISQVIIRHPSGDGWAEIYSDEP